MTKTNLTKNELEQAFCEFFCKSGYIKDGVINRKNRFSSQDECYNYFQESVFGKEDPNFKEAGFRLGFYLASYGMFRGSTGLLDYGIENFEEWAKGLKEIYSKTRNEEWGEPFISRYNEIKKLILGKCSTDQGECSFGKICEKCSDDPKSQKKSKNDVSPTQTLITKIMLGVFGDFPAIDTNFNTVLQKKNGCTGIYSGNDAGTIWTKISKVYDLEIEGCGNIKIKGVIDDLKKNLLNLLKDNDKDKFSDAKILDALFFTIGRRLNKKDK